MADASLNKLIIKTGLDKVFYSIVKNKSLNEYDSINKFLKNIANYGSGSGTDLFIEFCRDYLREHPEIADPYFSKFDEMFGDKDGNGLPDFIDKLKDLFGLAETQIYDPIALDLDGDGVETMALGNGPHFDLDANGFAETSGWVGADDGLLVRDINANGQIDDGLELFGNATKLKNGQTASNGFEALAELDSNQDGKISSSDTAFASLKVWRDANSNGKTDAGELLSLAAAGVNSINLSYTTSTQTDQNGNDHQQIGSYTTLDGSSRAATDIWFAVNKTNTIATEQLPISDEIAALPDIKGYGNLRKRLPRGLAARKDWLFAAPRPYLCQSLSNVADQS